MKSFLHRFQETHPAAAESAKNGPSPSGSLVSPDPAIERIATGTQTRTDARETSDQDRVAAPLLAITSDSIAMAMGTQTKTATRESGDQDRAADLTGTETFTRTREQADQDVSNRTYFAIPRPN